MENGLISMQEMKKCLLMVENVLILVSPHHHRELGCSYYSLCCFIEQMKQFSSSSLTYTQIEFGR